MQVKNDGAECANTQSWCFYSVWCHNVPIKTRLSAATELHSLQSGLKKKKRSHEFTHFHLWIFYVSKDFDVCESGPGQGAEAWVEDWGLMKRSTTVACCVCLPFSPAAWSMERRRGPFYMTKETSETWAHTLESDMMAYTLQSVPRKYPCGAIIVHTPRHVSAVCFLLIPDFV